MKSDDPKLESHWIDDGSQTGQIRLALHVPSGIDLPKAKLAFTALVRIPPDTKLVGGCYFSRTANYHEIGPLPDFDLDASQGTWEILIPRLSHRPGHFTDGPNSAFLILPDGTTRTVHCAPMTCSSPRLASRSERSAQPSFEKQESPALGMLPAARKVQISHWRNGAPAALQLDPSIVEADVVAALYARLFPSGPAPFTRVGGGVPVQISPPDESMAALVSDAYRLVFSSDGITLEASGAGCHSGLISLAQIWRAARMEPDTFGFPEEGTIEDRPAHQWRGMHLDVSRQIYGSDAIVEFLDILAWHKFNQFHWHLTDDEGWRLESVAYPTLTSIGAWRGHGLPLLPQHGSGSLPHGGYYSAQEVRRIIQHAASLNIDITPEIDVPGHCYAALVSVPELVDPSAQSGGISVQGYVNNALNPGLHSTWRFLETIFGELCDLFPGRYVHIGGDEVANGTWNGSRAAMSWARAKGLVDAFGTPDTMKMQAEILRFVAGRLASCGKTSLAWEEAAKGGGVDPDKTILMAWMKAQSGEDLAAQGYRVIMCPGEAYYLDMAQSTDWYEPGLSWAGTSSPGDSYHFDPMGSLPSEAVFGLQGCIWSETLVTRDRFNHMVFPRLYAIAERAWGSATEQNWRSFEDRQPLMPRMPSKA